MYLIFFEALNKRFTTSVDIDITMNTNRPCFIRVILKSGLFLLDKRICDLFYFGVLHVPEKVDIYNKINFKWSAKIIPVTVNE